MFWSSADLTGNQTARRYIHAATQFWSSADLTGNQTTFYRGVIVCCFGAVPI